ncbi:MAG: SpoIIE family protein phosphatase, partial [Acidimicrobiia bacterium]
SDHIAYLNAGHPPIAVIDTNGMELLSVVHRPWLGVETQTSTATTGLLKPGQLLLLYTDELVEEREISLSMRRFVIAFDQLIRQPVRMKWSSISSQAEFNNALLNR